MDVFLIDSRDLNKQDKQTKFLRQAVSISGEIVPLEFVLSDKLLPYRGNLFHLSSLLKHAVLNC